jgi:hypothetical protein
MSLHHQRAAYSAPAKYTTISGGVTFRNVEDHFTWACAGVYGPNVDRDKRLIWDELVGFLSWCNLPWCIGGDFNVTRFHNERYCLPRAYGFFTVSAYLLLDVRTPCIV